LPRGYVESVEYTYYYTLAGNCENSRFPAVNHTKAPVSEWSSENDGSYSSLSGREEIKRRTRSPVSASEPKSLPEYKGFSLSQKAHLLTCKLST
jgi:hypothetical protein